MTDDEPDSRSGEQSGDEQNSDERNSGEEGPGVERPRGRLSPHDATAKDIFGTPAHAKGLIRLALGERANEIDLDRLRARPTETITNMVPSHSDIVFESVGVHQLVILLIENQSTKDTNILYRLGHYVLTYAMRWVKDDKRVPELFPILVLQNRSVPHPGTMADYHGHPTAIDIRPFVISLADLTEEALMDLPLFTPFARLGVRALRDASAGPELVHQIGHWRADLADLDHWQIDTLVNYLKEVTDVEVYETIKEPISQANPYAGATMTSPNELARKAASEAASEAHQQGREEGREDGKREILTRILELRDGPLAEPIARKVAQADAAQLDAWVTQIIADEIPSDLR